MIPSIILSIALAAATNSDKPTVIYVGDPMCSWCYGIGEELTSAQEQLGTEVDWQLLTGGLRAGGGDEWTSEFTSFLKHHWQEVSAASGQPFSYELLSANNFLYDTEPSCRAVVVVQSMDNTKEFVFFKEVQKKFYVDNEDPKRVEFYESICSDLELDYEVFAQRWGSEAYRLGTEQQFAEARSLGVSSFPTILVSHKGKYSVVSRGFTKSEVLVDRIRAVVAD